MSRSSTEEIELRTNVTSTTLTGFESRQNLRPNLTDDSNIPNSAVEAIPDGGYGWVVVFACSTASFLFNGWSGAWGVLQAALIQDYPNNNASTSTLAFVGSLSIALCVALGLVSTRLSNLIGARYSMLLGVVLVGLGCLLSSFTVSNIPGLFMTAGVIYGLGDSILYAACNILPVQWFSSKLGTANGVVKLGGGVGATLTAIILQALINKIGIPWALRVLGFISLAAGVPAALLVRERTPSSYTNRSFIDLSLFKNLPFCCLFAAGAIGTFALFIPPFFLPLFAHSIGLSASTGAGIVAAFNACTAVGRFGAGFMCDKFGPTNMLLLSMGLNAVSTLAIWPVSSTIAPLVIFSALNGIANGAFFVAMPTAIASMLGPGQAAVGMGMAITGWTGGYLMGSPIAGFLITAAGAENATSVSPYRSAIFYAGGVTLASAAFILVARLRMDTKLIKRL